MKILLDEQLSTDLIHYFPTSFQVFTPNDLGWSGFKNGMLREKLNERNFNFLITADKNMSFQQNFNKIEYSIILLDTPSLAWEDQILFVEKINKFLENLPELLPKLVWVNIENFASSKKIMALHNFLSANQILFL